jgi:uncharacterized membrane protein YccC
MRARLRDPVWWTNALQIVKTVLAAVVAWVLAVHVFHIEQAFLAPWAALLTVHATVYRTLRRGVQQVGATVLGVLVAFAFGSVLGLNALSLGLAILVGLIAGSARGLRAETTTAAATALVVLTTGASDDPSMLLSRLLDTGIGIAVGLLVNLLVWPPLRDRSAAHQIDALDDRIGELLSEMAEGGDPEVWIARTREVDADIDSAWGVVRQAHESGRLNPRRAARGRMEAAEHFEALLHRIEQANAETRSMARTIHLADMPPEAWPPTFRAPWLVLLGRAGRAVTRRRRRRAARAGPRARAGRRSPQGAVQIVGGADQRQVGEGLREVAERVAGRADLLRVEPEVVRVGEHLLERQPRLVQPPGARERLDVPERADRERALVAAQAVR